MACNEIRKAKQWALIDDIYENATATFVAMAGADDSYGPSGAKSEPIVRWNEQLQAVLAGHTLASFSSDIFNSVEKNGMVNPGVDIPRSAAVEALFIINARSGRLLEQNYVLECILAELLRYQAIQRSWRGF
ncbi:hypothetical protein GGR55DRAFT_331129 [Xylaria sp. FL0064]|nr:hypothetical protein GGR55DRAFT_331129 [Xylaria sp. FL0064]